MAIPVTCISKAALIAEKGANYTSTLGIFFSGTEDVRVAWE